MSFLLNPHPAPWGDYGRILHHGMSTHLPRKDGLIQLERTGPNIFPITFPMDVVVTAEFKAAFESSGLRGAEFRPALKTRIVELDWSDWDEAEDEPPVYPESGGPEDYILERPHVPALAWAMPDLFELSLSDLDQTADIYHLPNTWITTVSAKGRDWFVRNYGDFVSFKESSS